MLDYRERLLATKQVTSPTYEAVAEPIYTRAIGRWKNYERLLEPAMQILEPFIREFGYKLILAADYKREQMTIVRPVLGSASPPAPLCFRFAPC